MQYSDLPEDLSSNFSGEDGHDRGPKDLCITPRLAPPAVNERSWNTEQSRSDERPGQQEILSGKQISNDACSTRPSAAALRSVRPAEWNWSVGVTTAPRANPTLVRTLQSLADAGWDDPHVFAEPGCDVPEGYAVTRRGHRLGAWPNWYLALTELVLKDPQADVYALVQDDVLFSKNCRSFLEWNLWPAAPVGLVSLYCPSIYHADKRMEDFGPHAVAAGVALVGALTYFFPPEAAQTLLLDRDVWEHRRTGWHNGLCNIDSVIGRWAEKSERQIYYYAPSLATHIGDTSSIWRNHPPHPNRTSASFLGEHFDATHLIK